MADMRRKYTTKRKLEYLEEAGETLLQFIDILRESESKRLKQFLYLIQICSTTPLLSDFGFLWSKREVALDVSAAAHARELCLLPARSVAALLRVHRDEWGIDRMVLLMIQWCSIGMFTLHGVAGLCQELKCLH
ncbi:uncharacterized protein BO88DRAFT_489474 [Aspergillus vadensis CBS 113365]|uniref:Uncharacterized protein n=1 Tax=Aspergillus vadensis (strain CBS 113365 / IMI 142717 / IBT 24658) TaxID=1448311 RepID=A0A319B5M6_ASPVC|nr:hypothetical protein BO88DRAFT_489474 [Aspergillus vadensis CBS 113365]PYH67201.1 hypothetical protein BO88DRAFT_489474 [Aspergillus vadensis CBS 113365]